MPDVSIIIPVHNRTHLLPETLVSCLIQTYQDHEVIVVDDGSTEDVPKAVQDACVSVNVFSPVKYVRQPHSGANAARNRGVKEAVGQFIQFVDSDDLLHPRKTETLRDHLVRFQHVDMAFGLDQYFRVRPGDMSVLWNTPEVAGHLDRFLWDDPPWSTGSPLWRRSALDRIGPWDVRLHCWQDWEFHIRALCRGIQYVHVPVILQYIRNHRLTRISNVDSPIDREESKIVAAIAVAEELKTAGLWTGDCGDAIAAFLLQISMNLRWLDAMVLKRHALDQAAKYAGGVKLWLTARLMQAALILSRVSRFRSGGTPLGLTYEMAEKLGLLPHHKVYWSTVTHEGGEVPFSLLQALDVFANRDLRA